MPHGTSEVKHYHNKSRQFFYILSGEAIMETNEGKFILTKNEGIEIAPMIPHKIINHSEEDLHFIVVSNPKSHGDRVLIEE